MSIEWDQSTRMSVDSFGAQARALAAQDASQFLQPPPPRSNNNEAEAAEEELLAARMAPRSYEDGAPLQNGTFISAAPDDYNSYEDYYNEADGGDHGGGGYDGDGNNFEEERRDRNTGGGGGGGGGGGVDDDGLPKRRWAAVAYQANSLLATPHDIVTRNHSLAKFVGVPP